MPFASLQHPREPAVGQAATANVPICMAHAFCSPDIEEAGPTIWVQMPPPTVHANVTPEPPSGEPFPPLLLEHANAVAAPTARTKSISELLAIVTLLALPD